MGMLGLHIALTDDELAQLRSVPPEEQSDFVSENFEVEKFGSPDCCETDKSWAYIHSALNGTDPDGPLEIGQEKQPGFFSRLLGQKPVLIENQAKFAIMGHDHILSSEDYYIGFAARERVDGIATALGAITADELGDLVRQVHQKFNASGTADDAAEYAMGWYPEVVSFYRHAADSGKHVIFTVSY
jgi:Domain of unknown function (DUF1877)